MVYKESVGEKGKALSREKEIKNLKRREKLALLAADADDSDDL